MIRNAKIISTNTSPETYNAEEFPRGSAKLTVRAHVLSEILRNAQRWVRGYQSPDSKAKKFGTLFDCYALTPTLWKRRYCVLPDDAPRRPSDRQRNAKKPSPETVAAVAWWDNWTAANPGEVIESVLADAVRDASNRLNEDKLIRELIEASQKQVMLTADWEDKATGLIVPVKCLIDIAPPADHLVFSNSLWDLKTTANASPRQFSRDAQKYRYDLQGAFYLDLWNAATGEMRSDFGHVVMENFAPYEYRTPPPLLSQRFLDYGRVSYQAALALYCRCVASGQWPSYDQGGEWPITDCDDWHLDMERLFPPLEEPEAEEEEMTDETADIVS